MKTLKELREHFLIPNGMSDEGFEIRLKEVGVEWRSQSASEGFAQAV